MSIELAQQLAAARAIEGKARRHMDEGHLTAAAWAWMDALGLWRHIADTTSGTRRAESRERASYAATQLGVTADRMARELGHAETAPKGPEVH